MIPIGAGTVGVEHEDDLAMALGDTAITYIFLAVDITLTSGKTINPNRTSLVIDGTYETIRHRLTDMNSIWPADTIGIRADSAMTLTLRNMNITGQNYYGVPYVYELTNTANLSVIYEDILYAGPQLAHNQNGLTRFQNCDITISPSPASEAEEVCEANRVELGGQVTIRHNSTNAERAVFYYHGNAATAAFTVLPDANVTITTANNYFMYNAVPVFNTPIPVAYTIGTGATFTLNANRGISYSQSHQIASFTVAANASFRYIQTSANGTEPTLYLNGGLTVNQGARFYMQGYDNAAALIRFTNNAARLLTLNNPKSFVLYSRNAAALSFAASTNFTINGGQINYWPTAMTPLTSAGTFADPPQSRWHKRDYLLPLTVTGSVTQAATTIASSNITDEDQPLPALANLHLHDARELSVGELHVSVDPIIEDQTPITGLSDPNANILVEYTLEGAPRSLTDTADPAGAFTILVSEVIPLRTAVTVSANVPFLYVSAIRIAEGVLAILDAPTTIRFITPVISLTPLLLGRDIQILEVTVSDRRLVSTAWELVASIDRQMQTESGDTLPNAVVFVSDINMTPLSTDTPITVYTGGPDVEETTATWLADRGILLNVTAPMLNGEAYTALLTWEVRPI